MSFAHPELRDNLLINGGFQVAQRNTSFDSTTTPANNDDTYLLDRWLLLSDGNDIVDVSQESTTVPTRAFNAIKLDQETANKQWAIVQIVEARNSEYIIDGAASLSFKARKGGSNVTAETLRAAVISWDSTADVVTSDVIGTWAGAGTDPTLATNWTYENTPSDLTLTTSYQLFRISNIPINTSGTNNVAVIIWLDDTDATVGDLVFISEVKLEYGTAATPFQYRSFNDEMEDCLRYFQKDETYENAIYTASSNTTITTYDGTSLGNGVYIEFFRFPVKMRTTPTVTAYPYTTTSNTSRWSNNGGTDYGANSAVPTVVNSAQFGLLNNSGGALTVGAEILTGHWFADAEL